MNASVKKPKTDKKMTKVIQQFYDDSVKDPNFLAIMDRFTIVQQLTGIADETILIEAYEYLDKVCQERIKESL